MKSVAIYLVILSFFVAKISIAKSELFEISNHAFIEINLAESENKLASGNIDFTGVSNAFIEINSQTIPTCFDTIFTKDGDTILCKIIVDKIGWFVNYELPNKSKENIAYIHVKKTVKCIDFPPIIGGALKKNEAVKTGNFIDQVFANKKYRIGLIGILAVRINFLPKGSSKVARNHYNQLRLNFGIAGEFHVAITKKKQLLLGGGFSHCIASATTSNVKLTTASGGIYSGILNSNASISTIGTSAIIKFSKPKKFYCFALQAGLNLVFYNETFQISNYNLNYSGFGTAPAIHFLYDYKIDKNKSFGLNIGYDGGSINLININENGVKSMKSLARNEVIGLSRFTLAAGIRFWF